jgi:hypothetical protein
MNSFKKYFATWDFTRYFRLGLGLLMLIGYFSTKENIYLVGSLFLSAQAIFNFGCMGGACATNIPEKKEKSVMEFEKYEPQKSKENV